MKIFIGITTYERLVYLKQLLDSLVEFSSDEYEYLIVVNDDGSKDGTREYLANWKGKENMKLITIFSNNKGGHFANNNILHYARNSDFDYGFNIDDDLYFIQKGWEKLYINSGLKHAVHYSTDWQQPRQRVYEGNRVSFTDISGVQGAFWTFTKEVLEKVGYIDDIALGKRGGGHEDFTRRCCKLGFNEERRVWDALGSDKYIKLHGKEDYLITPRYWEILEKERRYDSFKNDVVRNRISSYIPLQHSPLNMFFEKIYVLSLKRRQDRRDLIKKRLEGIDFEFFDAIDGQEIEVPSDYKYGKGAYACFLSHRAILEDIQEKGYGNALILEDDVLLNKNIDLLANQLYTVPDWDLLYLGASDAYFKANLELKNGSYYRGKHIDGTFAYAVNKRSVQAILTSLNNDITLPVDTTLHGFQENNRCYVMYPHFFIADVSESDIRGARSNEENAKRVNWTLADFI